MGKWIAFYSQRSTNCPVASTPDSNTLRIFFSFICLIVSLAYSFSFDFKINAFLCSIALSELVLITSAT